MFVLDCSVSASWCLRDETNDEAAAILRHLDSGTAMVPGLWVIEMANVMTVAERRKRISPADAERAVQLLLELPIHVEPADVFHLRRVRNVAREYGLSAYDGAYLELAQRRGLALASFDEALLSAAHRSGVPVLA